MIASQGSCQGESGGVEGGGEEYRGEPKVKTSLGIDG